MVSGKTAILGILMAATAVPALAQDVVVMRRSVAPPRIADAPSHWEGEWTTTDWVWTPDAPTCGPAAPRTRTAACMYRGAQVADRHCKVARPAVAETALRTDGCRTEWVLGQYGQYSPSECSATATRSRTNSCETIVTGGTNIKRVATQCDASAQENETTVPAPVYSGCSFNATYGTPGRCTATTPGGANGIRTAAIASCRRSDGTPATPDKCSQQTQETACTLTYEATYSQTYGACTGFSQSAPVETCTAVGSDGSRTSVSTAFCSPQAQTRPCSPELLSNGDMEARSKDPWVGTNSDPTSNRHTGDQGLSIGSNNPSYPTQNVAYQTVTGLTVGWTYVLTGYMFTYGDGSMEFRSEGGGTTTTSMNTTRGYGWTQGSLTFTATATTHRLTITNKSGSNGGLDDFSLKRSF